MAGKAIKKCKKVITAKSGEWLLFKEKAGVRQDRINLRAAKMVIVSC